MAARAVSWLSPARRDFEGLPAPVRDRVVNALAIAAEGGKASVAKPLRGFGPGILEIRCNHRGDTWRAVYALYLSEDIWVIDVFMKKSHEGRSTPLHLLARIESRLARLKEILRHDGT